MDCIKAGTLSHISRICLNDEPVASDDRPHAILAWTSNSYPPNISFYPSGASTMKNMWTAQKTQMEEFTIGLIRFSHIWPDQEKIYRKRKGKTDQCSMYQRHNCIRS